MHPNSVYSGIKTVLSRLTGRDKADITSNKTLGADWPNGLGFTDAGTAGLVQHLNVYFSDIGHRPNPILHPGEFSPATTVGGIFSILRHRV